MTRSDGQLSSALNAAVTGADSPLGAADLLCRACVDLLAVDGAAISMVHHGTSQGTFGSSGELSRRLDELQFTLGEGPCLDSVLAGAPVHAPDLSDPGEHRWPAFTSAVRDSGITAVFALPVAVTSQCVGALDLFRTTGGPLTGQELEGGLLAAELAALPLLDLMTADVDWEAIGQGEYGWEQLASLERVEVYQATGMIIGALGVGPAQALSLLRARAFAVGSTASELAWAIVDRRELLEDDAWPSAVRGDGVGS